MTGRRRCPAVSTGRCWTDWRREVAASGLSPKRLRHVLAVRDMAARLAELYCPEDTEILQAAALLHDMTKELSPQEQIALCDRYGIPRTRGDVLAPKCFHAMTAAALIPVMYPAFADPRIVSAVRWHTTGRVGMTLDEKLIYLADYIDESSHLPGLRDAAESVLGRAPGADGDACTACASPHRADRVLRHDHNGTDPGRRSGQSGHFPSPAMSCSASRTGCEGNRGSTAHGGGTDTAGTLAVRARHCHGKR